MPGYFDKKHTSLNQKIWIILVFHTQAGWKKSSDGSNTTNVCGKNMASPSYIPICVLHLWNVSPWLQDTMFESIVQLIY